MKISPDDPKITAFALGEIDDPAETKRIEAAVDASPELQEAVHSIRATSAALEEALAAEAAPDLSEADKGALSPAPASPEHGGPAVFRKLLPWLSAAAVVVMIGFILLPSTGRVRESARRTVAQAEERQARMNELIEAERRADASSAFEPTDREIGTVDQERKMGLTEPEAPSEMDGRGTQSAVRSRVEPPSAPSSPARRSSRTRGDFYFDSASQERFAGGDPSLPQMAVNWDRASSREIRAQSEPWNTDAYDPIDETDFRSPLVNPLSTFSIDVDTASYAQVRRFLSGGRPPPANAVRIEELVNYFPYADAPPTESLEEGGAPFAVHLEQATAPWASQHRLLRVNLKGYELPWKERPASNLVFLMDVSGSMNQPNKLPLVKEALRLLVDRLDERDRVAIVVYAGASGIALPSTTANNRETIEHAIDRLAAGGSTNAGQGIELAYATARKHFIEDGNNRVILCTDGDFNVGITDRGQLGEVVQENADEGVSLTVLGFGMGNYKDNMLEELSTKGKGGYGYIDTQAEARKFFLQQLVSNLFTIAHDVKIQAEFNPAEVKAYRLIGYENRRLKAEEFNDDTKRAGNIGPGHTVTAFYEIVPAGVAMDLPGVDQLRYQAVAPAEAGGATGELATVKLRYKRPGKDESELLVESVPATEPPAFESASDDLRFGAAVAGFGMRLRGSEHVGDFSWEAIQKIAVGALGQDPGGHRAEFSGLVERAARLSEKE